jgi:putative flippase GtrA
MSALQRTFRFGLAGACGFLVDLAVLMALIGVLGPVLARAVSFVVALTATWVINRHLAFGDRPRPHSLLREYAHYATAMLGGGALNWLVYLAITAVLAPSEWRPVLALAVASIAGMGANLLLAHRFVFPWRPALPVEPAE